WRPYFSLWGRLHAGRRSFGERRCFGPTTVGRDKPGPTQVSSGPHDAPGSPTSPCGAGFTPAGGVSASDGVSGPPPSAGINPAPHRYRPALTMPLAAPLLPVGPASRRPAEFRRATVFRAHRRLPGSPRPHAALARPSRCPWQPHFSLWGRLHAGRRSFGERRCFGPTAVCRDKPGPTQV